jgi:peptide-methionine (S)-S-oxide reductase
MKALIKSLIFGTFTLGALSSCAQTQDANKQKAMEDKAANKSGLEVATFGTGCFWCTEAQFEMLDGVESVVSGYSGGFIANPTYEEVCSKQTGHIECAQILYDPKKISYVDLLEGFFRSHDATSKDRQGNDVGPQYRSAIFFHNDAQKALAEKAIKELDASGAYSKPIVTEVRKAEKFYKAEEYHQNYYAKNPYQGYCSFVVAPKVDKFKKVFKEKLKKGV